MESTSLLPTALPPAPRPLPLLPINVRAATLDDLAFIDALQKKHSKQLGFFPRAQMEGYIKSGWVLIAEEKRVDSSKLIVDSDGNSLSTINSQLSTPLGYVASRDRYLKRDELGAVFQLCIEPGKQRGLIGANLLRAVFERASYGTKLFCCWCAQDLEANHFWEAMGFVPLAFRTGSRTRGSRKSEVVGRESSQLTTNNQRPTTSNARVHIFWEKRIRQGDTTTPWWFPSQTTGGSIREDRLVLPIPPGVKWSDEMPIVLPEGELPVDSCQLPDQTRRHERKKQPPASDPQPTKLSKRLRISASQFHFADPAAHAEIKAKPAKRPPREKVKNDPKHVAAARELRDRYLEKVNDEAALTPVARVLAKYDVSRAIEGAAPVKTVQLLSAA